MAMTSRKPSNFDRVLITKEENYTNPVGVIFEGDKIIMVQGASSIIISRSQLSQLNELRQVKRDWKIFQTHITYLD